MILRTCVPSDMILLRKWSPSYTEMWKEDYTISVDDPLRRTYVAEVGFPFTPVGWGQIKFEDWAYTLGWFIAPEHRNQGGGKLLGALLANMCGRPIRAKIRCDRLWSERIAISLRMTPIEYIPDSNEKWWEAKW